MPNYFFITLSICIALITFTLVYRNVVIDIWRRVKKNRAYTENLENRVDELLQNLQVEKAIAKNAVSIRSFDEGMLSFMTVYYNENKSEQLKIQFEKVGSMMPGIGHPYGDVKYSEADQKFVRVIQ